MIYSVSLPHVALAVGFLLSLLYGLIVFRPALAETLLKQFPRHYPTGLVLSALALGWFLWLLATMDLMEYTPHRTKFLFGFSILGGATAFYLREFLAVRALGILLLLLAKVMLDAAFLRDDVARLAVVLLAYALILKGMIIVVWPYLVRDGLTWFFGQPERAKWCGCGGFALGVILILLGAVVY